MEKKTLDKKQVAAVCGNEVIIFDRQRSNGTRQRLESSTFSHYGAALAFATEFDDKQRRLEALGRLQ